MKFEIALNEEDYLNQILFAANKSKKVRQSRRVTLIMLSSAIVIATLTSYSGTDLFLPWWGFVLAGFPVVILYYFYQRNLYRRLYRRNIVKTYQSQFHKPVKIEFTNDQLLTQDDGSEDETRLDLDQLEHIYETSAYFFMRFETGETLIVPKNQVPLEDFKVVLKPLIEKYNIPFTQELNWKFK